jgi:RNA polymerase sigma-70 factor, ECF subfamily
MDKRARAIEELYRDRYVGFRNALATVTGSDDTARDAVQEGFARALAKRRQFRGGSLAAWVWRIAFRAALEARGVSEAPVDGVLDPQLVSPERDPALAAAIAMLPARRRLIVFLRYFADFSYSEIAAVCDISEGTVAATLAQAHQTLAETLEPEGAVQ